jgi:hypothetical protein
MMPRPFGLVLVISLLSVAAPAVAIAQTATVAGSVRDETGGMLSGASVEVRASGRPVSSTVTDFQGGYTFDRLPPGRYELVVALVNFATSRREVSASATGTRLDIVLHLALNADVTVTGKRTFANLIDIPHPEENLVGVALAATEGAITAPQIDHRPIMRAGEVLETVPGVIISQHSGEGKANQYYLRGFNLDHGTDFATTVAGMPVNMPSHAHGQGYSDLNFLIPELVSGVQFSKGPYYAEQGDFSAAGAATINYANVLDKTVLRAGGGEEGYGRFLFASSPRVGPGHLLTAFEVSHDDGPWVNPDQYRRANGVLRYSQGTAQNGFALTAMGYDARWNSTDQVPVRAIDHGLIPRFGAIEPSDGGDSYRYSGSAEWQRTHGNAVTSATAYIIGYHLNLFSNFTYFLNDPVHGDQFEQLDQRIVSGGRLSQRRLGRWRNREIQQAYGVQIRNDAVGTLGLFRTEARVRLSTTRLDEVNQTNGSLYYQNEVRWSDHVRTVVGIRGDRYRFRVASDDPLNSGTDTENMVSPKSGIAFGPWRGTELYVNAGYGFHSNDARGATIVEDPVTHQRVNRVTPLVRAKGAEFGIRTVVVPHLQSTVAVWTLGLASELVFSGDAGTTEAGRPSRRSGIEWTNFFSPKPWLTLDADVAFSKARFTDGDPIGDQIPGAAGTIVSIGGAVQERHHMFGALRLRYFGPRPLIEDNSVRSNRTSLLNADAGYRLSRELRVVVDVFNLLNSQASDVDYYYASRLPGEPLDGVNDIHTHPITGRTARISLLVGL